VWFLAFCRLPVVPTVTVLAIMKARLQGATKGHALLKKKADALSMRFRQILKKIVQAKEEMGVLMKNSFFSLAQARYAAGDFRQTVLDGVDQANVKVKTHQDNVAGVKLPRFESVKEAGDSKLGLIGLGSGGKQVQDCRCRSHGLRAFCRCSVPPGCLFQTSCPAHLDVNCPS
jgi:V-type H+-transporting ATPase subunit D